MMGGVCACLISLNQNVYHHFIFPIMAGPVLAAAPNGTVNGKENAKIKSKNQYKRLKAKQKKAAAAQSRESSVVRTSRCQQRIQAEYQSPQAASGYETAMSEMDTEDEASGPTVEYVPEALETAPGMEAFSDVFARFKFDLAAENVSLIAWHIETTR